MRSKGLSASASESSPWSFGEGSVPRTLLLTLFAVAVLRAAWLSEDAYTTFRTVDNFVGGYGLRWNVAERVQAFTHPLWMLLVSAVYSITHEIYYSVILLSLAVSVAAMYILAFRVAKDLAAAVLVIAALTLSRAFVDYSTSGLENPLTHLLLAVFFLVALRDVGGGGQPPGSWRLATVSLWGALAMLNRLDIGLIVGPPMLALLAKDLLAPGLRRRPLRSLGMVALGFSPLVAWELFSLFYYGFPFPNTAYGKLFVVHPNELAEQGVHYLLNSLSWDPLTLTLTAAMIVHAFVRRPRKGIELAIAVGGLLYLLYVARIGGDFMSGRYLTAPLVCGAVLLARARRQQWWRDLLALGAIAALGGGALLPTLAPDQPPEGFWGDPAKGIADERLVFRNITGLVQGARGVALPNYPRHERWAEAPRVSGHAFTCGIGMLGYYAGPGEHIIDRCGLADPLLARLPIDYAHYPKGAWRIGHYPRQLPGGYAESVAGDNVIVDPALAIYWEKLRLLTRGPLLSWHRLAEVWRFNTGRYDHLVDEFCARNHLIDYLRVRSPKDEGTAWNAPGNYLLNRHGIGIRIGSALSRQFTASLAAGERYELLYLRNGERIASQEIDLTSAPARRLIHYRGSFRADASEAGFDMIRFVPLPRPRRHSFGHLRLAMPPIAASLEQISIAKPDGAPWDAAGNYPLAERDLMVFLNGVRHATELEISADCNDRYEVRFFLDRLQTGRAEVPLWLGEGGGLQRRRVQVPRSASERGYDRLLITPLAGDSLFSIGHVRLLEGSAPASGQAPR